MPRYLKTKVEIAKHFGVGNSTIQEWARREWFPKPTYEGWDLDRLEELVQAHREVGLRRQGAAGGAAGKDLQVAKLQQEVRKLRQETRFKRLKNDLLEQRLIDYDDVSQWIAAKFLRVKQRLQSLPNEMQVLAPNEQRSLFRASLESFVTELLIEMSDWTYDSEQPGNEPEREDSEAE